MRWFKSTVALAAILVATAGLPRHALAQEADATDLEALIDAQRPDANDPETSPGVDAYNAEPLLAAEALDEIVAPVALYPDALLAQVLVAATYPLQVVKAGRLLEESEGISDDELTEHIAAQDWDPSILVLLSGFPTVVERMADDLDWTEALGNAMLVQDDDVLAAVQRMREQALDTGYLTSNAAQVVEEDDDQIYIRPADPEVVYVPNYDPALAFTSAPTASPYIAPPRSGFANPLVAGAIAFGATLLVQELFADDDSDDGWDDYWDDRRPIDWRDRAVLSAPAWPLAAGPRRLRLEPRARRLLGPPPRHLALRRGCPRTSRPPPPRRDRLDRPPVGRPGSPRDPPPGRARSRGPRRTRPRAAPRRRPRAGSRPRAAAGRGEGACERRRPQAAGGTGPCRRRRAPTAGRRPHPCRRPTRRAGTRSAGTREGRHSRPRTRTGGPLRAGAAEGSSGCTRTERAEGPGRAGATEGPSCCPRAGRAEGTGRAGATEGPSRCA